MESVQTADTAGQTEKVKRGISGSTLKIIAIVVMLIDHIGAVILTRILLANGAANTDSEAFALFIQDNVNIVIANSIMRAIGRLGFPIFCFLLVEGFQHTRNVKKYAVRLLAFAAISELPFNLAITGNVFDWGYQNVFFTLFIGLLVMIAYRYIEGREELSKLLKIPLYILSLAAGLCAAQLLKTDYAAIGVACIMALYIFRKHKPLQIAAGCVAFLWEVVAPLAFIPIGFYNGRRGLNMKYFFYAFYPVHLLVLYLIAVLMGIA